MILSTFRHLKGIGPRREQSIWRAGIRTWEEAISEGSIENLARVIPSSLIPSFQAELWSDYLAFQAGDIQALARRLAPIDHWRLLDSFPERALYLDIETGIDQTGLDVITVIGTHCTRYGYRSFVDGRDMELFPDHLSEFSMLVTFNGASFDLPVIRQSFRNISIPDAHVDLMWTGRRAGFRGTLKKMEKALGIPREPDVEGLSGYDAVLLWNEWMEKKDQGALEKLIKYNRYDTVNLEVLALKIMGEMKRKMGFDG